MFLSSTQRDSFVPCQLAGAQTSTVTRHLPFSLQSMPMLQARIWVRRISAEMYRFLCSGRKKWTRETWIMEYRQTWRNGSGVKSWWGGSGGNGAPDDHNPLLVIHITSTFSSVSGHWIFSIHALELGSTFFKPDLPHSSVLMCLTLKKRWLSNSIVYPSLALSLIYLTLSHSRGLVLRYFTPWVLLLYKWYRARHSGCDINFKSQVVKTKNHLGRLCQLRICPDQDGLWAFV